MESTNHQFAGGKGEIRITSYDEKNNLRINYSLYKKNGNKINLIDFTNSDDKKIGLQLIKEIINSMK